MNELNYEMSQKSTTYIVLSEDKKGEIQQGAALALPAGTLPSSGD
jgi:hypothetical protein